MSVATVREAFTKATADGQITVAEIAEIDRAIGDVLDSEEDKYVDALERGVSSGAYRAEPAASPLLQGLRGGKYDRAAAVLARTTGYAILGAGTGAAVGAGIGALCGGVGAVPGAQIGATVGGIAGALTGLYRGGFGD